MSYGPFKNCAVIIKQNDSDMLLKFFPRKSLQANTS